MADFKLPNWIYFVQASESGKIKIGCSTNPFFRLAQLRVSSAEELYFLAMILGSRKDEAAIHSQFSQSRVFGEWFYPSTELLAFIDQCPDFAPVLGDVIKRWELNGGYNFMILQPRYPARRYGDDVYVLRAKLTVAERMTNIQRLRKEAGAKNNHADVLEAETKDMIRRGELVAVEQA